MGLDIIKIKSFSNSNGDNKFAHSSESVPKIRKQDSMKAIEHNKYLLSPIKPKYTRDSSKKNEDKPWDGDL